MTLVTVLELVRAETLAFLGVLTQTSIEGGLVAGVVWLLCRTAPGMPAAVRAWLWWLVALKLLLGLLPVPAIPLAWLPARTTAMAPAAAADLVPLPVPHVVPPPVDPLAAYPAAEAAPSPVTVPYTTLWPMGLAAVWLVGVGLHATRLVRASRAAGHLRRSGLPVPAPIARRAVELVRRFMLPVMPDVLATRLGTVPLLTGVLRPAILLPERATATLSRTQLDLVLGHELAHVRRGDLAWGWVPALAARLFFFHPLARLATREYLAAREEACDAEVLQVLEAEPAEYGRLLLTLGVAPTDDVLAAAGTSPTFASLKRRLTMLDRSRTPASRWWWGIAGATAALVPLTLAAQSAVPTAAATAPREAAAAATVAPAAAPAVAARRPAAIAASSSALPIPATAAAAVAVPRVGHTEGRQVGGAVPPVPPAPPAPPDPPAPPLPEPDADVTQPIAVPPPPPAPPAAPAPPVPPPAGQEFGHGSRRIQSPWVILDPGNHNVMSGSDADRDAAQRNRTSPDETLLWFRYRGTAYVTRDAATIAALRQAFAPVNAAAREMSGHGAKQGTLGSAQGTLGARQGELGARQGALAGELSRLVAERLAITADQMKARQEGKSLDDSRLQVVESRRRELEKQMHELSARQRALGMEMQALGKHMEAEGAVMRQAGRTLEQALVAADASATALFAQAVASGAAARAR